MNSDDKNNGKDGKDRIPPHKEKDGDKKPAAISNNQDHVGVEEATGQDKVPHAKYDSKENQKTPGPPCTPSLLCTPYPASYHSQFVSMSKIIRAYI